MRHDEMLGLLPRLAYGMENSPGLRLFALELLFWLVVILLTLALVRYRPALLEKAENSLRSFSQRTSVWLVAFPAGVIVLRLLLLHWLPIPVPIVHDEFSYLLGADTFAHARLTNPPSPMWVHYESFHINVQPTYQSMYPPAQGMALAVGQVLTHVPWVGVLLTTSLMCGAIYWMLLGWLPPTWAWLGGAFACVRFGIFSYWMNSYWGGAVAAIGGALVLGAFPRLRRDLKMQTMFVFAIGLLILANSRPLEGLLFSIPLMIALAVFAFEEIRSRKIGWGALAKVVLPAAALLMMGAMWMLFYNWRGTGNPLEMPYQVNFQTYHISKPFLFEKPNPIPEYHHLSMRAFYVFHELPDLMIAKYDLGYLTRLKGNVYYAFFIWPFALLIGPCVYAMWRSELRVVLFSVAFMCADLFAQVWPPHAHYAAPAVGAVFLALLFSARHFRNSQSAYAIWGSRALVMVMAVWMLSPIAETLRDPYQLRPTSSKPKATQVAEIKAGPMPLQIRRARIQSELEARPGKQLIIVHYPSYSDVPAQDWIYNDADIDNAHVVWARDMGYLKNKELLKFFPDRQAWFTDRGDATSSILPYDEVMAPIKLAFDAAAEDMNTAQVANVSAQVSSAKAKTTAAHRTENLAPHSW
jgi:hypothetical protein